MKRPDAISWLFAFIPATIVLRWGFECGPVWLFFSSALSLIPLARQLCRSTEQAADRIGEGLGGMLNATFGNAPELIIGVMALRSGMYDVVKASITGSIIGNILLVYGSSALIAGLRHSALYFNQSAAGVGATMLALSVMGLSLPAVFSAAAPHAPASAAQSISLFVSLVMGATYLLSLLFSLKTHRHLYAGECVTAEARPESGGLGKPLGAMALTTVGVALMSEVMVGALEGTANILGLNRAFMGIFFLGILGNAAEHSATVYLAMKKRMDAAINITAGASIQVALFVTPALVCLSYAVGPRPMDLLFSPVELAAIAMSVVGLVLTSHDGDISWIEGVQLLAIYSMIGVTLFFLPNLP